MTALPPPAGRFPMIWGAAAAEIPITPGTALSGYPFVDRRAVGVHDALLAGAIVAGDGAERVAFVIADLIAVSATIAADARARICAATGILAERVLIAATHTHSGPPVAIGELFDAAILGEAEAEFAERVVATIVRAVVEADARRQPGTVAAGWGVADPPVGSNRRDARGASDPRLPVVAWFDRGGRPRALLTGIACHPTILPAEFVEVSGDLNWGIRTALQEQFGLETVALCSTGAAGNQSTRYTRQGNDIAEVRRLGAIAAASIATTVAALGALPVSRTVPELRVAMAEVQMPLRWLPTVEAAETAIKEAEAELARLRGADAPAAAVRTAEVVLFGARHTARYARRAAERAWPKAVTGMMQAIAIGPIRLLAVPAELFIELALEIEQRAGGAPPIVIAYAGDLLGYVTTDAAFGEGGYEPTVALLGPGSGERVVAVGVDLLRRVEVR